MLSPYATALFMTCKIPKERICAAFSSVYFPVLHALARLSLPVQQSFNPALSFLIVRKSIFCGGGIAKTVLSSETIYRYASY